MVTPILVSLVPINLESLQLAPTPTQVPSFPYSVNENPHNIPLCGFIILSYYALYHLSPLLSHSSPPTIPFVSLLLLLQ